MRKIKGLFDLRTTVLSLLLAGALAMQGVSASWVSANFVRKGGPAVVADATAINIMGTAKLGQVPLNVQQRTNAGVDAFKVSAAGQYRFRIDANGACALNGAFGFRVQSVAASTTITNVGATATGNASTWILVTGTSTNARAVALPLANSFQAGSIIFFTDYDCNAATNNITIYISNGSGDTIRTTATGATSSVLNTNGGTQAFVSDGGTVWKRLLWAG